MTSRREAVRPVPAAGVESEGQRSRPKPEAGETPKGRARAVTVTGPGQAGGAPLCHLDPSMVLFLILGAFAGRGDPELPLEVMSGVSKATSRFGALLKGLAGLSRFASLLKICVYPQITTCSAFAVIHGHV